MLKGWAPVSMRHMGHLSVSHLQGTPISAQTLRGVMGRRPQTSPRSHSKTSPEMGAQHKTDFPEHRSFTSMGQAFFPDSKSLIPRDPFLTVPQEPRGWGKVSFILPARYCQSLSVAIQKYHPQLALFLTPPKARMPRWQQTWCR